MPLVRVAGGYAALVSAVLLATVLVRDIGLNPLNGWTIALGFLGSVLLLLRSDGNSLFAAIVVLVLAMIPALPGGLGFLYVPALVLSAAGGALRQHSGQPAA